MRVITLIAQLCALCAMSALVQMTTEDPMARGGLRTICGLLMQLLTLSGLRALGAELATQRDLTGIFACLMK